MRAAVNSGVGCRTRYILRAVVKCRACRRAGNILHTAVKGCIGRRTKHILRAVVKRRLFGGTASFYVLYTVFNDCTGCFPFI